MRSWSLTFIVIGVLSFVLPMFNLQFRLLRFFGNSPVPGFVCIGVGVFLYLVSPRQEEE